VHLFGRVADSGCPEIGAGGLSRNFWGLKGHAEPLARGAEASGKKTTTLGAAAKDRN